MTRVAVFGTGSWGTAFAAVLADAGSQVRMWGRRAELVDQINQSHVNGDYLPDLLLPAVISATTDPQEAVDGVGIVVLAVPSQTLRANLTQWVDFLPRHSAVVSLMQGRRAGHHQADERSHRRRVRCRSGADRRGVGAQPGQGDRGQTARSLGRGLCR